MGTTRYILLAALCLGCGATEEDPPSPSESDVGTVPLYPQRGGSATRGWDALITEGYVGCGIPKTAYDKVISPAPPSERLPGRTGANAELPYNLNAFTTAAGVDVIAPNCLQCHAERLNGELVIGLGNHTADYTGDLAGLAILVEGFVDTDAEHDEWKRWSDHVVAVGPYTRTATVGVNPADNLAAVLFAHRDPETLAWSNEPLMDLPPEIVVPVDVPPWWRMAKKNAMFYDAAGRGDHARIMMTASTLCVDSVEEARAIDAYFPDVSAFVKSLEAPQWPWAIDAALAAEGEAIFSDACAHCHGTYGEPAWYPNEVIALDVVGTDATLATGAAQFAGPYVDWFNRSFFGELAFLAPAPGYLAPPLDGVWATAPYLHNGSVPSLRALLDSSQRPSRFALSLDTSAYDQATMGWPYAATDEEETRVYDTSRLGYGNDGHTYGDELTAEERDAVLEYLKTI